nr:superoxide reductase [Candidatus Cloacimonadota bacterium]
MIAIRQIWHCPICGNTVEAVFAGQGELVCCGKPMQLLEGNTVDAAKEKHIPVVTEQGATIKVEVGSVHHPMEEKHYIAFIEVLTAKKVYRHELKPGDAPVAEFPVKKADVKEVRAYCNLHGLWKV